VSDHTVPLGTDNPASVGTTAALRELYRLPAQRSLDKEIDHLDPHCRAFIAHSPFAVLATADGAGTVDASPKGGPPGFVAVVDDYRVALPDMAGNNRLDSMTNIVHDGAASLLFLIPGIDETLRVVGRARVSTDVDILERCAVREMPARVAIVITVSSAFIHCAKALLRAAIWDPASWPDTSGLPSPACMLKDHIGLPGTEAESQRALDASYAATTWAMG
jgi:PPOX class probable FMN-dependent enzyme